MNNNLINFLNQHRAQKNEPYNYVSMGYPKGKFYISKQEKDEFINLYSSNIGKINLHIAEIQPDISPFIIDIDFEQDELERK